VNASPRSATPLVGTYICEPSVCAHDPRTGDGKITGVHCWHESTARRLEWQGGPSANAAADLASWNDLGQRRKRAA